MHSENGKLNIDRLRASRDGCAIGRSIEYHDVIDSTNKRAKELAKGGAPHGSVVLADSQTGGRGRFDRRFYSPPGSGLYLSIILRSEDGAERVTLLTPLMAVAVARTIEALTDVKAQIKWVNDVYITGRKVCGILCEAGLTARGSVEYVVAGIGVNVGRMEMPGELRGIATSVSNECGKDVSVERFAETLMDNIEQLLDCESDAYMREYAARSNVVGRDVTVLRGDERFEARAEEIDLNGDLIVRLGDGSRRKLNSGEISLRFI